MGPKPKVLVTGANGFIGSHVTKELLALGCQVHAVVRGQGLAPLAEVQQQIVIHRGDVLDDRVMRAIVGSVRPEVCIHLAWFAKPNEYLTARENLEHVVAGLHLAEALIDTGCQRFVGIGTCFEYDTALGYLSEASAVRPHSLYAASKLALCHTLRELCARSKMSFAWARLFYQYGPFEHEARLVAHVISRLLAGEAVAVSDGKQVRDFLHVTDVARALASIALGDLTDTVNVGSGVPVSVREIVQTIGRLCHGEERILYGALPQRPDDPFFVCAVADKLREISFAPRYDLPSGLNQTVQWHRARLGQK